MSILVISEHRDGAFNKTSFEAVAAAQSLALALHLPVSALILGSGVEGLAQDLAAYDLDKVVYGSNEKLKEYTPDAYTDAAEQVIRKLDPRYVVMAHTYLVRDFAPKLAARFQKGLISDCVRTKVTDSKVTFTRRIFLGKIDADIVADGQPPVFVTFQSGAYRADQALKGGEAKVEGMSVDVGEVRMKPEAPF
jgi:electron transfer flavoprotein alpha subunit